MNVEIDHVQNHYEVFIDGEFICTADTTEEAKKEAEIWKQEHQINQCSYCKTKRPEITADFEQAYRRITCTCCGKRTGWVKDKTQVIRLWNEMNTAEDADSEQNEQIQKLLNYCNSKEKHYADSQSKMNYQNDTTAYHLYLGLRAAYTDIRHTIEDVIKGVEIQ